MMPDEEHGFGSLFLCAFLKAMGIDYSTLSFEDITIGRELRLDGGRIDLFIDGKSWVLAVENKIRHWLANDLELYRKYAALHQSPNTYLAVLSPDGETASGWSAVTYRSYCAALRKALGEASFDISLSKWYISTREFIIFVPERAVSRSRRRSALRSVSRVDLAPLRYIARRFSRYGALNWLGHAAARTSCYG